MPDLSGEVARKLDELVYELLDVGAELDAETEAGRWLQAAQVIDKVIDTELDAMAWWDTASALRARAERVLGPDAHGRSLGPCPVLSCPARSGSATTRPPPPAPPAARSSPGSTSRPTSPRPWTPASSTYETVRTWSRTRNAPGGRRLPARLHERHDDGAPWRGIPWPTPDTGLYSFRDAFTLVARRETRVRLEGSAA